MKAVWMALACGWVALALAGCGVEPPEPADPYAPAMSRKINEVIYSALPPEAMAEGLVELGVGTGGRFADFKAETGIDDWFGEEREGGTRYTSFSCGLSPVVDGEGRITGFFRNRRVIGGKVHGELSLAL